jgi:hypothetical protein
MWSGGISMLTDKERKSIANDKYYEKNKERLAEKWKTDELRKEKLKVYYQKNKEIILERAREWHKINKKAKLTVVEPKKSKILPSWIVNKEKR